jgi:probable rRNA maturation factor
VPPFPNTSSAFNISLANEQSTHPVDATQLIAAVRNVLAESVYSSAAISVAVVDDATMHELNRRHLEHDYPTDVLSFALDDDGEHLEGEIIISADTAAAEAVELGWPAAAEQLLYVIHGTLHLVGHGDKTPDEIAEMRAAEQKHLRAFGLEPPLPSPPGRGQVAAGDSPWRGEGALFSRNSSHPNPLPKGEGATEPGVSAT